MVYIKKKEKSINKRFIILFFSITLILLISSFSLAESARGSFFVQPTNICGDSFIGGTEECDTDNLAGQTCQTLGYDTGVLTCDMTPGDEKCMFNETDCSFNQPTIPPGGGGGGYSEKKQCNDKIDNDKDGLCDYFGCIVNNTALPADPGCTNEYDGSEKDASCFSSWKCDEWGKCVQEILLQQRTCTDINYCKQEFKKIENQDCFVLVEQEKCIFLWLPCWLWLLILAILIISAIYYYYKKKKEAKDKALSILLPKKPTNQKSALKPTEEKLIQQKPQIIQPKSKQLTTRQKSVIAQIASRKK